MLFYTGLLQPFVPGKDIAKDTFDDNRVNQSRFVDWTSKKRSSAVNPSDRASHNFRIPKSFDRRNFTSSETSIDELRGP